MRSGGLEVKVIEGLKEIQTTLESLDKPPWSVTRAGLKVSIFGDQVMLTDTEDADYLTLEDSREALTWLVDQLGGTVKWQK
jgi:hypothetical protein